MNSLFVKSTDIEALKSAIAVALDATKLFEAVNYFHTKSSVDGYSVFLFRGGLLVSSEYAQILSKSFNTLAIAAAYESSGLKLEFFENGTKVFSYSARDDFENGNGIEIEKIGNVADIMKFCVDSGPLLLSNLTSELEAKGTLVFYWRSLFINVCKSMGLQSFTAFVYWNYANLSSELQKNKSFEQLYKLNEIPELDEVVIKPA